MDNHFNDHAFEILIYLCGVDAFDCSSGSRVDHFTNVNFILKKMNGCLGQIKRYFNMTLGFLNFMEF